MRSRPQCTARSAKFALVALCLSITAVAQPTCAQPKPPLTDWPVMPNSAVSGSFAVAQLATADADQFMADWRKPTPTVRLQGTSQIRRNRPITTFIAFRGCRANKTGKCNVTATFDLRGPSGKIDRLPAMDVWTNQPQPPRGIIQISHGGLGMIFNATDPLGTYTLKAAVTDHVAGITLRTQRDITVSN